MTALDLDAVAEFARGAELELVVLFGSQASGNATVASDYDLALMPSRPGARREAVERALVRHLRRSDLDLVWLPHAPWLLAWQVAQGRALYEAHPGSFHSYWLAAALRRYDGAPWHARNLDFSRRVLERRTAVDRQLLGQKTALLGQYLAELEQVLPPTVEAFVADLKTYRTCERQAELLVECAAAINTEVGGAAGIAPSDYYSSFFALVNAGWLELDVATRLADMAGLRNRLVHQYEKIQLPQLHRSLVGSVPDWRAYLKAVLDRL